MDTKIIAIVTLLSPLIGAIWARTLCTYSNKIARDGAMVWMTIALMGATLLFHLLHNADLPLNIPIYTWFDLNKYHFEFGFWIDGLSLTMLMVVMGISWFVHLYSYGYMVGDPHIGRYFSYVSFFTFSMLVLILGNNLLQVFFGWEGVGVASYLLIGFWQTKEYPAQASIKAFVINRIADMGLLVAIGLILLLLGELDFGNIIHKGFKLVGDGWLGWSWIDWICILMLTGAMGKSAQIPLHVWLPDSMAGPTPISALIHAATMVTAGIYLIARFAPWFEYSMLAQSLTFYIGILTMLLMGLVAITENDIKKIIAYSTLSQLGMMIAACGISGYVFSIYHLLTHACFKALLFLSAGGVIVAMDHEQDIRKMGGLVQYPTLHISMLIGLLSMIAIPPFSGFFSKDALLLFARTSTHPLALIGYVLLILGALITAVYSTRLYCKVFWEKPTAKYFMSIPLSMRFVLWALSILSVFIGYWTIPWVTSSKLATSMDLLQNISTQATLSRLSSPYSMVMEALESTTLTAIILTVISTLYIYLKRPHIIGALEKRLRWLYCAMYHRFGFDLLYTRVFVPLYGCLSAVLLKGVDEEFVDRTVVLGSARKVFQLSSPLSKLADGKVYHYILVMLVAVALMLIGLV